MPPQRTYWPRMTNILSTWLNGKEKISCSQFFTPYSCNYNTKGHCYKLTTTRCHLDLRKNFFSQRVVHHWNELPDSVVNASTVNTFKNRLDREWGNKSSQWTLRRHLQVQVQVQVRIRMTVRRSGSAMRQTTHLCCQPSSRQQQPSAVDINNKLSIKARFRCSEITWNQHWLHCLTKNKQPTV